MPGWPLHTPILLPSAHSVLQPADSLGSCLQLSEHLGGPNSHLPARQHCTLKRTSTAGIASDRSLSTSPQTSGSHQSPRDLLQPSLGVPEAAASAPVPRLCPGVRAVPATSPASSLKLEFASGDLLPAQPVKQSALAAMPVCYKMISENVKRPLEVVTQLTAPHTGVGRPQHLAPRCQPWSLAPALRTSWSQGYPAGLPLEGKG